MYQRLISLIVGLIRCHLGGFLIFHFPTGDKTAVSSCVIIRATREYNHGRHSGKGSTFFCYKASSVGLAEIFKNFKSQQ